MPLRLLLILFAARWVSGAAQDQTVDEYQVKAAFIYNFAKFVEWPPEAFKTPHDPLRICVFGHNPFGNGFEAVIRGKSMDGRALAFLQVSDAEEAASCHILFVSAADLRSFRSLFGNLKPAGILTVGESQGFAAGGGMINFKLDGGRVRFQINIDAAEHAQLHISSKLLSLAEIVKTEKAR